MENKTAKHTPGPWRVGGGDGNLIFAPDGCVIAQADACDAKHFKEDIPNARLIASAPELLQSAVDLLSALAPRIMRTGASPSEEKAFKNLESAIAKAEGH